MVHPSFVVGLVMVRSCSLVLLTMSSGELEVQERQQYFIVMHLKIIYVVYDIYMLVIYDLLIP